MRFVAVQSGNEMPFARSRLSLRFGDDGPGAQPTAADSHQSTGKSETIRRAGVKVFFSIIMLIALEVMGPGSFK